MLKITEFEGPTYVVVRSSKDPVYRNDYIKFESEGFCLILQRYRYEKLSKKKRSLIFAKGVNSQSQK